MPQTRPPHPPDAAEQESSGHALATWVRLETREGLASRGRTAPPGWGRRPQGMHKLDEAQEEEVVEI